MCMVVGGRVVTEERTYIDVQHGSFTLDILEARIYASLC